MKKIITITLLLAAIFSQGQENKFWSRDFWKASPDVEEVKSEIAQGTDPVALNENGFDAVTYSILENADLSTIKYLLSIKGNAIDKITHDDRIYLHWAAYKGNLDLINYLLDQGSDVNAYDDKGQTPVTFAAAIGNFDQQVYKVFIEAGVDLKKHLNKDGQNILLAAARRIDSEEKMKNLLDLGVELYSTDNSDNNLMHQAVLVRNLDLLKLLKDMKFSPNDRNENGYTPLHFAAMKSQDLDILTYLVEQGADKSITTEFEESAYDLALENEYLKENKDQLNFLRP
ncbi:hypothetical protein BST97_13895 [Nonlabens spongiae]|uniref:Uncharacterized protein n=1 Tax=Nonlabens spongiae TaxID=331648 RepID=A0A1W6MN51_9FLAO|nr:ankyrin repeat domain-containing protein [Nonlabens spongiae]ARN78992.1 hypothetical protein BST97_13895 [Nonlabens spongiae]